MVLNDSLNLTLNQNKVPHHIDTIDYKKSNIATEWSYSVICSTSSSVKEIAATV